MALTLAYYMSKFGNLTDSEITLLIAAPFDGSQEATERHKHAREIIAAYGLDQESPKRFDDVW